MEYPDFLPVLELIIAIAVMLSASYFDKKYREVPDIHWWVLGLSGIAISVYVAFDKGMRWQYACMLFGMLMILMDILWDSKRPRIMSVVYYATMAALFIIPILTFQDQLVKQYIMVAVYFVVFYLMYIFGILRGGADTKCLMVMGLMFQTYPVIGGMPLISIPAGNIQFILTFQLALLFHAALFSLAALFWIIIRKVYRKNDPVDMYTLTWYRMGIDEARKSHVWAKQDVVDGMIVNSRCIPDERVYDRLESVGAKDVWVTPIIPFMIPITVALVFIATVGNLLFLPLFNL